MTTRRSRLGLWFACAMAGALVAYLYAVLTVEPLAHGGGLSAWEWFWQSYGGYLRRGLLFGGVAGLVFVWLVPRSHGARRERP